MSDRACPADIELHLRHRLVVDGATLAFLDASLGVRQRLAAPLRGAQRLGQLIPATVSIKLVRDERMVAKESPPVGRAPDRLRGIARIRVHRASSSAAAASASSQSATIFGRSSLRVVASSSRTSARSRPDGSSASNSSSSVTARSRFPARRCRFAARSRRRRDSVASSPAVSAAANSDRSAPAAVAPGQRRDRPPRPVLPRRSRQAPRQRAPDAGPFLTSTTRPGQQSVRRPTFPRGSLLITDRRQQRVDEAHALALEHQDALTNRDVERVADGIRAAERRANLATDQAR